MTRLAATSCALAAYCLTLLAGSSDAANLRDLRWHITDHLGDKDFTMIVVGTNATVPANTQTTLKFVAKDKSMVKGWVFRPKVSVVTSDGVDKLTNDCGGAEQVSSAFVLKSDDDCLDHFRGDHKRDAALMPKLDRPDLDQDGVLGKNGYTWTATTKTESQGFYYVVGWKERKVDQLENVSFCLGADDCTEPQTIHSPRR